MSLDLDPRTDAAATPPVDQDSALIDRMFRWVSLVALAVVMVRVTIQASHPLNNSDTWFHLRLGENFLDGWSIHHPGGLTRFATSDWVPTQWSSEIAMAKVVQWFGLPGLAWMVGTLFLVFIVTVFLVCRAAGAVLPATVATGVVVIAAAASLSARPQIVSLILFAAAVAGWWRAAHTGTPPWFLVPTTWVWATAHGLWTAAVLFGVVSAIGIILDRRPDLRLSIQLLAVPVLSVVAACLTPLGPRLLTSQLAVGARTALIPEWGPTSFREVDALLVGLMVAALVVLWARGARVGWTPVLQVLLGAAWAVLVVRMLPFGALVIAPHFVAAFTLVMRHREPWRIRRPEVVAVFVVAALCSTGLAIAVPNTAQHPGGVPSALAPRLAALPAGSSVLVEEGAGAWIEWRFPTLDPIIDGMLDAYPVSYMKKFASYRSVEPGWTDFVTRSGARVAVVEQGSPLAAALQTQLGWTQVQKDAGLAYLVAPGPTP